MIREPRESFVEQGIVLHTTKYGEGQLIVHMLSRLHSRCSYITRVGGRKGDARRVFAPLSIVEFNATKGRGDMGKMAGAIPCPPLFSISENIVKCTLALFVSELLYRVVRTEDETEGNLYEFVRQTILALEKMDDPTSIANFHLYFMVHLASHLGYEPRSNWGEGYWFDIRSGEFTPVAPMHSLSIEPFGARIMYDLLLCDDGRSEKLTLSGADRSRFLYSMVDYYAWHTDSIHSVRSIAILSEIF